MKQALAFAVPLAFVVACGGGDMNTDTTGAPAAGAPSGRT